MKPTESWTRTVIGDVCQVVGGATPNTGVSEYWGEDIPWITPDDLSGYSQKYISSGRRSLTRNGYASCSASMLPAGSVLFSSRAPIGYVAIAAGPVCTNQGFKSLIPSDVLLSDYLYWYMKWATPRLRERGTGTTFREVSKRVVAAFPIAFPLVEEQRRIVATIEERFSHLEGGELSLETVLARCDRLYSSVLASCLGDGEPTPLENVVDILDGRRVPVNREERAARPGGIPYYGATGQVGWIDGALFDEELILLGEDGAPFLDRLKSKAYIINGPSWVNNHAHVLKARETRICSRYLCHALNHIDYSRFVNGTTRMKLTQGAMRKIEIALPSLIVQQKIVDRIDGVLGTTARVKQSATNARKMASVARRLILSAAFSTKAAQ